MSVHGVLNYLSPLDKWEEIKPYEISGRVAPGQPKNNFESTPYDVIIHDARQSPLLNNLEENGFEWATHVTEEPLETDTSISKHIEEMEAFIKQHLRADMVKTFQYQIRKRALDVQDPRVRPPSNLVHVDVSRAGAEARIRFSFPDEAERILDGRHRLLSLWRPLFSPLEDYPLAVCDANSVDDSDLVESDYIYPNFESESLLVKHSERHKWFYLPGQTKDELLIITNYDSRTQKCVPHSGFELPKSTKSVRLRESIEIKVVVLNETETQ